MRFLIGGGGGTRTLVQSILSDKDYMFRSRFFIPSEISEFSHRSVTVIVLSGNHTRFCFFLGRNHTLKTSVARLCVHRPPVSELILSYSNFRTSY